MNDLENIHSLSITQIRILCSKYDTMSIKEYYDDSEFLKLLDELKHDERKGVVSLFKKFNRIKEMYENEVKRVNGLYEFDRKFNVKYIAGVDEVGRGPLAGPIVAASVILDLELLIEYIDDSKKIKEEKREELSKIIKTCAVDYNIVELSNKEIDEKGIGYCNNEVFIRAVEGLTVKPQLVLTDGYLIKNWGKIENKHVIKGDTKSASIACASILAKVYRDNLMKDYHNKYSHYNFKKNVGYGTQEHVNAIKEFGVSDIHRKSFLTILNY